MQYRKPVGCGPSLKTWPKCPPQRLQCTSVRCEKRLMSSYSATRFPFTPSIGCQKLGQPVPESNYVSEVNNGTPQPAHRNVPGCFELCNAPVNARSVPCSRRT